ncbi:MAG: hypothetical protein EBU90_17050 [Proteobacteria bacterium]|nr:hypothetical protein [Pseudomonadota bacterium]
MTNKMSKIDPKIVVLRQLIREIIESSLLNEDNTPGGGLTDFGAKFRIEKSGAISDAMKALAATGGDATKAAKSLGVSTRRMYDYISMSPKLDTAQDKFQDEERKEKETEKRLSKDKDSDDDESLEDEKL